MRYIIGFLITIGLIILAFILILRGGNDGNTKKSPAVTQYTNTSTVMQLTIEGPVNANQIHNEVRITVGKSQTNYAQLIGYENTVVNSKSYDNNATAYADFLNALARVGYTKGNTSSSASNELGACPAGTRYIYEILNGAQSVERFWYSSCNQGTYGGNAVLTNSLFKAQVPDYDNLTSSLAL
jgi:hypothetical protein